MAIYDWPTTRTFLPQTAELRVVDNTQRALESPMSGYVQTLSMPGARWGWGFDFGAHSDAERDALEAFLLRLNGREHRMRLWDLKRPRPRGKIQTAGVTLAATAAQFATTLQLAGCRAAPNLLLHSGFEADTNADNLADGWQIYAQGSYTGYADGLSGGNGSAFAQRVTCTALGATASDQYGLTLTTPPAVTAGQVYTLALDVRGTSNVSVQAQIDWYTAGGSAISTVSQSQALSGTWSRIQVSGAAPALAATARLYVFMKANAGGTAQMDIDNAQLEVSATASAYAGPATLQGGDWIGLTGGQLVRVVADAAATDAGAMTVDVRHMLRSSVASGSAVTLDRPTALFVRTEAGLVLPRMPGLAAPPMSAEFVEVFA